MYGALRRLYAGGHLTSYVVPSEEGSHRKYHAVNDAGRALLDQRGNAIPNRYPQEQYQVDPATGQRTPVPPPRPRR